MHEISVARNLLVIVRQHVPRAEEPLVREIRVRVGELSGVSPDALAFSFQALVGGTPLERARLVTECGPGDDLHLATIEIAETAAEAV